jgi:thiamine phosphate synthase YjbQ (UPF0047 family)
MTDQIVITEKTSQTKEVRADLEDVLRHLVPDGGSGRYRHEDEGPDVSPLTEAQLSTPIADGRPVLRTWQGIYLWGAQDQSAPARSGPASARRAGAGVRLGLKLVASPARGVSSGR